MVLSDEKTNKSFEISPQPSINAYSHTIVTP